MESDMFQIYEDINFRTKGEIYIGVVGPVRSGKSTFIKNFMETVVIPQISDENDKKRAIDELPQSGAGHTITTTEPKFIPKEAISIKYDNANSVKVRLIDCVGYMIDGATGHLENNQERMVKTPWLNKEIPFSKAAKIGTEKVITEHSTIGIVITSDGSINDIPKENYEQALDQTITTLKITNKPFLVIVNSTHPYSEETKEYTEKISKQYNVITMPVNCMQIKKNDILTILNNILQAFPVSRINFNYPSWCKFLDKTHPLISNLIDNARKILSSTFIIHDIESLDKASTEFINSIFVNYIDLKTGNIGITFNLNPQLYYKVLSEMTGMTITNDYMLISTLKELSSMKNEITYQSDAINTVNECGYSVVHPLKSAIEVCEPELIKHGNKYGIKIKATATSIHMIKAPIETEIAPIVGTMEQAKDLIEYIKNATTSETSDIWDTNIFGKSVEQLINEGIDYKINRMSIETRQKMQHALKKIVNESSGGVICIII